ncbi:MAG: hypothetical protein ACRDJN_09770 [Chloroflexota bacterium]
MNLRDLYETSIRLGMALDLRGEAALQTQLARRRQEYAVLPAWQQPYYDQERFRNPFGDVRIANGPEDVELRTIMLGIDIHVPELLLADRLRSAGTRIDAVIAHHAHGIGVSPSLSWDTMAVMVDMLVAEGVAREAAEQSIYPYIEEKLRGLEDFHRIGPDTARLLHFPLACIHTPADYYITVGVRAALDAAPPRTVEDVVMALLTIPEVQSAARLGAGPRIMTGEPSWPSGRILLKFGGGYILPPSAYPLLGQAGVNTVLQIACGAEHARAAQEAGVAIVRIPHAACDNIGLNLLLDDVERELGPLQVIPCGYFERISHR